MRSRLQEAAADKPLPEQMEAASDDQGWAAHEQAREHTVTHSSGPNIFVNADVTQGLPDPQ